MKNLILFQNKYLLQIAIVGFLTVIVGVVLKITHFNIYFLTGNLVLSIWLLISLIIWILVFFDIFRTNRKNSLLWMIAMFLFFSITPLIYLITNKK